MHPKAHIFLGAIFTLLLFFLFPKVPPLGFLIVFLSSFLIDGDHYVYYLLKEKKFNLIKCYNWYKARVKKTQSLPFEKRKKIYTGFYFFHGVEWLIILFLLGKFVLLIFTFVLIGFSFHLLLDIPSEISFKGTCHKLSLIYNYTQFKKLN